MINQIEVLLLLKALATAPLAYEEAPRPPRKEEQCASRLQQGRKWLCRVFRVPNQVSGSENT